MRFTLVFCNLLSLSIVGSASCRAEDTDIAVARIIKYGLWALAALLLCLLLIWLWLRWELARVQYDSTVLESYIGTTASQLQPEIPAPAPCAESAPEKRAFFGGLHVHTAASYDATAFGVTNSVEDAYAFARGEPVELRLRSDAANAEVPVITISEPMDFLAVTDHAEQLGEASLCYVEDSQAYHRLVCKLYRGDWQLPVDARLQPLIRLTSFAVFGQNRSARVCGDDGSLCRDFSRVAWDRNQQATEQAHDGSSRCTFTAFHAYEYTLAEQASNLHRNIIFSSDSVPQAIVSAKEAPDPEDFWAWLESNCIDGNPECDVISIPHNANWSSGRMWFPYSNQDLSSEERLKRATRRARLEPLAEIMQVKGDSECRNGIASVLGAPDEFCDFEKLRPPSEDIPDCGEAFGAGGMMLKGCASRYSYLRYALAAGMKEQRELGVNPFQFGIVAASDNHNGAPAAGREQNSTGSHGYDRDPQHRLSGKVEVPGDVATGSPVRYNPGGIAGVYASENSRAALFQAMREKETFGTSGPRITPRFFAGWGLTDDLCEQPGWVSEAYRDGVAMGGELSASPGAGSPTFIASAAMATSEGATPLQRIQVVKAWVDVEGQTHQSVHNIAGDADNGAGVDTGTCQRHGQGFSQLCTSWRDPGFDAALGAVYYLRVLENPSCRWSQWDCLALPESERPATCNDPEVPKAIQERAWTSPIWVVPDHARG